MLVCDRIQTLAWAIAVGLCAMSAPALAGNCIEGDCRPDVTAPQPPAPAEPSKSQQPVALGPPTQVVKTPEGNYARAKPSRHTHRAKQQQAETKPEPPQFMPVVVSPEAAAALAMPPAVAQALAQVRIVDADELNEIDSAAEAPAAAPLVPVAVTTTPEPPVPQPVAPAAAEQPAAAAPVTPDPAISASAPAVAAPRNSTTPDDTWLSRLGTWLASFGR